MSHAGQPFLFEVSWEVCNPVGGISTVLASKARYAVEEFGDRYLLLGPELKANRDFEETDEEDWQRLREALAVKEIPCRFGRWAIPGRPRAILVDFAKRYNKDQLLYQLWEQYGVDSISGGWDYVEPVMFSSACGEVIETAFHLLVRPLGSPAVAQFHEWMCGAGLLGIKKRVPEIATVFTTHATILGRSLAGAGIDIYTQMENLSPQREAAAHQVLAKYSMEVASAREADCFTTVSQITATEAKNFLGRAPEVVLPNGLDVEHIPDYGTDRAPTREPRARLLAFASRFLRKPMPPETRILLVSGRYEFHNKGIDVFLQALADLQREIPAEPPVLALLFIMGGHKEINPALLAADATRPAGGVPLVCTHRLHNESSDPILEACNRLGLRNTAENRVNVIFMPAFLDGYDGLLNLGYYDALAASDLGVFPSYYEPWGYTPLESAAYAVPTVTTDQAGFGLWVRETRGENHGVIILHRRQKDLAAITEDLRHILRGFLTWSPEETAARRRAARAIAAHASWSEFFPFYRHAYETAAAAARQRLVRAGVPVRPEELRYTFAGTGSVQPHFRTFTSVAHLPPKIVRLRELAHNLWWTWHTHALDVFAHLDPRLWSQMENNPVRMLESVSPARLAELAENEAYLELYARILREFDDYMAEKAPSGRHPPAHRIPATNPVAYFSAEYGLHECVPIYSGGLGVLSGDHLKTASDLHIPMVAVGLLYKSGYFRQRIDKDGWQVAEYPENDFSVMPVKLLEDEHGNDLQISVELPGRTLYADVWEVKVGRIALYLLNTDIPRNTPQDRGITGRLYCADRRTRIEQEILLGTGGVKFIRRLGIAPSVYHVNEGHSAFLILERIAGLMSEEGLSFDEAREVVRGSTVFTTHTPVEAGNEQFPKDVVEYYFASYVQRAGISWPQFWELGRPDPAEDKPFYMTMLGLKMTYLSNAVSRMHQSVSRRMWQGVWKGLHHSDIPIRYVTNGIHVPSVVHPRMHDLLDTYLGLDWPRNITDAKLWKRVNDIPNSALWRVKCGLKQDLIGTIRENVSRHWLKYGDARTWREEVLARLNPAALIIGFARRFAPYKRADLILHDLDRLDRIVNHEKRPVHVVFAGKAHPNDGDGIELLRKVIQLGNDPRFRGKVFYLEGYDLGIARGLLHGVDVWLNTPTRPFEACGTSGQKAVVNGTLNLSICDGWWCEGYDGTNGWTIGPVVTELDPTAQSSSEADSKALYALIEEQVVPLFYERDESGVPQKWVTMVKRAMETLVPRFNSKRMVLEYHDTMYVPAAERGLAVARDRCALAREIADWKRKIPMRFSSVRLLDVSLGGIQGDSIEVGKPFSVSLRLDPGKLDPSEILVELLVGRKDGADFLRPPDCIRLKQVESKGGVLTFGAEYAAPENGRYHYGIRAMPFHPHLAFKHESELVLWA